jgi:ankyrin repeat protein
MVKHHVAKTDESRTGQFLSAAAKGQADRVKLLLQQGYNPNTTDYDKRTALMLATANGHRVRKGRNSSSSSSSSSSRVMLLVAACIRRYPHNAGRFFDSFIVTSFQLPAR